MNKRPAIHISAITFGIDVEDENGKTCQVQIPGEFLDKCPKC
ncbi:MAG: hypothetical protein ACLTKI_01860 [Lachnospiraceae bacterium]